ncbi:MAG TPA: sulfotransferase [Steroidobacteraceae bacterium]|nr:sulfotransferase [Steroidobacteraceae bacterium]
MIRGDQYISGGDYARAIDVYQQLLALDPSQVAALHNLGVVLCNAGRVKEAEAYFRRAIELQPDFADAHNSLGYVLRTIGRVEQAETSIRQAAACRPNDPGIQGNLAQTLVLLGRIREAEDCFSKILQTDPSRVDALVGLASVAQTEGRFDEAEALYKQALACDPKLPRVWASLASLRRMGPADGAWQREAEQLANSGLAVTDEISLRFAIGKYWDDVGDFERAFRSYQRANDLLKSTVRRYDRSARAAYVDDMIRIYSPRAIAHLGAGGSPSTKPVFVVGMPRSGTSLVEQIIAAHPSARGAGELGFWTEVLLAHIGPIRQGLLSEPLRQELAASYLKCLEERCGDALRIIDKAPVNAEYLGIIHSVFPNARVIYLQRNPIDTCLSCYFQYLSPALSYTMDLSDLASYYRQHQRLMARWREVLPHATLLDVPYEQLVSDQEGWTRRILDFIGLEWDARCLQFHNVQRAVSTASQWQVRQKMYHSSVGRWGNYEKFIGPLLELAELDSSQIPP